MGATLNIVGKEPGPVASLHCGGATRVPPLCFVVEVGEPGPLVVKHRRAGSFGKSVNVAVLQGSHLQFIF